jgi:two-component system phosphate regulon sensor histidine kinase PhoR
MANANILLVLADLQVADLLERAILRPAGYEVTLVSEKSVAESLVKVIPPDLIILGDKLLDGSGLDLAPLFLDRFPNLAMIFLADSHSEEMAVKALRLGFFDYISPPLHPNDVLQIVNRAIQRRQRMIDWSHLESRRNTKTLQKRLDGLEALQRVGRSVTSSLDLDTVLTVVVDSAVELTGAEEGSLLLLDEATGELYMRAARNFQDEFVRKFRLPIRDSLAGQVLRTGRPITIDEETPQKIKTSYMVHTLIYVPLQVHGRVIGVLGVDNRHSGHPFLEEHIILVAALADYAAIAIDNAHLYTRTEVERKKLETILTHVEDGVIVVDQEGRLVLANQTARAAFGVQDPNPIGKPARDLFQHIDLLEVLNDEKRSRPSRSEITLEDGRVFNAQSTTIPDVGMAIIMQDITHLKELDRIKSDFVSTVSHDLRSPLTAILGYVELIDRAGPITEQQREFIHRVQFSVNNITALINDLLDLGRIEAGFDARKEIVPLAAIINYAIEGLRSRLAEKDQDLVTEITPNLPTVLGNPVRLRQLMGNLIGNAIKYTPAHGKLAVRGHAEEDQIIIQVSDNGPGIPATDQPYIFDKFYRGSNIPMDTPGTGLGLAIVKSIVDNHQGRIWVDSVVGQGTTFTVVLPVTEHEA